jgi:phosphate transport system ATP-binding protein
MSPADAKNPAPPPKLSLQGFSAAFAGKDVLREINLDILPRERLAIIGPASSGKTTFLRSLNRLNDLEYSFSHEGRILFNGQDIYDSQVDLPSLRRQIGMVYAVPVPLPWSVFDNIAYGPRLAGASGRRELEGIVESALRRSQLWDEVKDRLRLPANRLSGGQQQRLCLARILALDPQVLLLDEPCSGLDPISTAKIEETLAELKKNYSVVLVTNNTKQAARASDRTAFFLMGELVEVGPTRTLFTNPAHHRTGQYITGHFG